MRSFAISIVLATAVLGFGFCAFLGGPHADEFILTVEGSSMAPTIPSGSTLKVLKKTAIVPGSIVAYRYPSDTSRTFIGRIVATPNDLVEVTDGRLLVNGAVRDDIGYPLTYSVAAIQLQDSEVFILGDNRNNSYDSHVFGPVWVGFVRGVVVQ